MKNLSTLLIVMLLSSVTALFAQAPDEGDAAFVAAWTAPIPSWWAALPADYQAKKQAVATKSSTFDAVGCNFDVEWAKIPGDGNKLGDLGSRLGLAASDKGDADFSGAFKVIYDDANIYILLQYTDDDVTGNETVEIAWAPYLKIKAPDLATLPQAWYTRYTQFGAYKATFKNTGFDAAMMVDGSTGAVNWGGTNDILSTNLFMDNHSTVGSKTIKYIYTIGYAALTGEARPAFDASVWQALNEGKGITFDMKVNDVDTDDALSADATPVKKPAEYWWNTKNNDCYALTIYAGFLSPSAPVSADAAYVKGWTAPIPSWWAALPAEEPTRKQAVSPQVATFDALGSDFDAVWAKIPGDGNKLGDTGSRLGLAASDKGDADFSGSFKTICDDANIYVLLQYTDDDVTGNETVEIAWAPYLKIDAPALTALPQAWYARYTQFGAYKATFKSTGFDAAMMIDGSTGAVNWGGTNDILSSSLFMDNHTAVGSKTIKQIYTIGYAALTGDARPDFNKDVWKALNEGKGISLDMKVNDVDTDDALSADATPVKKPAEYWWNTKNNDCYALTTYAGFVKPGDLIVVTSPDAAFVKTWTAPIPGWWAALPAEEPSRKQAAAATTTSFDAKSTNFDAAWAKIPGDGNKLGDTGSRLGLAASDKGDADFSGSFKTMCDEANIYILLQYTDDDVTGSETVEIAWAPYLKIDAPVLPALPQAWYARYTQFGAYKATFKTTGFDAAMMIDGSTGAVNWGGTNDILSSSLFMDNHTVVGSKTIKQIYTIGYSALTGEARPDFNLEIWKALNAGKGISLDMKVNDVDTDDALSADATPVKKPAEYWWNTKNNDCYALTTYAGFLKVGDPVAFLPTITSFVDNFDGSTVSSLWVPEHATDTPKVFVLTQASGMLNLNIDKNAGIDAGIGVYGFSALLLDMSTTSLLDLTVNPKVSISLKADKPLSLQVGLVQSTVGGNSVTISVTVPGDGAYHTYNFDFTGKLAAFYDPKQIDKVYLNFNPGWATGGYYKGNVTLDYLKIGDAALTGLNRLYNPADLSVYPNPAKTTIALKNSSSLNIQSIALVNMSGQIVKQINNYNGGSINVEDLRSGVYFVRVTTQDNALNTLKFIKQ
ncbi:MAG: T9SS type A sorting domain-containing protein [Bacteroidia bacterium]